MSSRSIPLRAQPIFLAARFYSGQCSPWSGLWVLGWGLPEGGPGDCHLTGDDDGNSNKQKESNVTLHVSFMRTQPLFCIISSSYGSDKVYLPVNQGSDWTYKAMCLRGGRLCWQSSLSFSRTMISSPLGLNHRLMLSWVRGTSQP